MLGAKGLGDEGVGLVEVIHLVKIGISKIVSPSPTHREQAPWRVGLHRRSC